MAYIGQDPVIGRYILVDQISGGFNGTASGFTLAAGGQGVIPGLAQNVLLSLGGVIQQPGTDYTVSGSGITFTTPPLSGTTFFATVLGDVQAVGTPSDGTVLPASIATSGTFVFPNITTTGTTLIASGNASTPSLAVIGDTNTGLYSPGADQLSITTGGTERFRIDSAGQLEAVSLGTAAAPTFSFTTDLNTGIYSPGADQLAISTNGTGRLFIDASGNVGVGAAPVVPFDVQVAQATQRLYSTTGTNTSHIQFRNTGGIAYVGLDNSAGSAFGAAYGLSLTHTGAYPITFVTNGIERLRITSAGLVGVGTSSPSTTLDVNGGLQVTGSATGYSAGEVRLGGTGSGIDSAISTQAVGSPILFFDHRGTSNAGIFAWRNGTGAGSERMRLDGTGRLGIGTTSPGTTLDIAGATGSSTTANLLTLRNQSASNAGNIAQMQFFCSNTFGGNEAVAAIQALNPNAGANNGGALVLAVSSNGTATTPTERARIDSSGRLLVGTTSAVSSEQFNVTGSAGNYIARLNNSNASPSGLLVNYTGASPNGTSNEFLLCFDNASSGTTRAAIRSNGGLANFSANNANLSDRNAKKDISPAADTWNCIKEWEIVNYRYKDQPDDADLNLGVIAQQVAESCPEVITVFEEAKDDQPEKLGVKEQQMYWMAIKALQEAQARIEALEADVAQLKGA